MDLTLFDRLHWLPDRVLLGEIVFRLEQARSTQWSGEDHITLHKTKPLVDQFHEYFKTLQGFNPRHVLELGILDGGSIILWHELFRPHKHVAVDLKNSSDNSYLRHYVQSKGLSDAVRTYWNTDQMDADALRGIVQRDFGESLDLVIDDASHMYHETKTSFEILFPYLRPGGIYLIEDWAWGHWDQFVKPSHPWHTKEPLTTLVTELVEATGSSRELTRNVTVFQGFAAVERGPCSFARPEMFHLADHIRAADRQQELAHVQRELDVILTSKSWRWTRPLREAMATLRRLFRKN